MQKSKFFKVEESNITIKNCPPNAKIKVYYEVIEDNKKYIHHSGGKDVKKSRLNLLEERMDRFEERMDRFEERMDRFEERMDRFEELIINLTKEMRDGFKQVNSRIDKIDARLDYNGLKKLPESR